MTDQIQIFPDKQSKKTLLGTIAKVIAALIVLLIGVGLVTQRLSDGPTGPIAGGELRSGALVTESITDWSFADGQEVELQLVDPVGSRITGVMVHDGLLYVPCDLGFMWGRFSGRTRWILHAIYIFKGWHKDAVADGRAVLRIDGKRYERQAVRVTDPELLSALRIQLEGMAREWIAPAVLDEAPTEGPNDIWFFRMDSRPGSS